jgi:hypothetical protein
LSEKLPNLGLGALFALVTAIVAGVVVHYLTTARPTLEYSVSEGPSLPGDDGLYRLICALQVRNAGSGEIGSVLAELGVDAGKIEQGAWRASPGVRAKEEYGAQRKTYDVEARNLEPGERLSLSVMIASPQAAARPRVAVRGYGSRRSGDGGAGAA